MKLRRIAILLCFASAPSIIPTHKKASNNSYDKNLEEHLQTLRNTPNYIYLFYVKKDLERLQNNNGVDETQIENANKTYNEIWSNIKESIQKCDAYAYACEHGVTPEKFIKKLANNTWSDDDVIAYTKYRIVYRLQQRISRNEASICNNDEQQLKPGCTPKQTLQSDVDSIIKYVLLFGIEVKDLENSTSACCCGHATIECNRKVLQINSPFDTIHTIEHEITHLEENNSFYTNRKPFNIQNDLNTLSRQEYAAEYEAARFVPFPYSCQIYCKFSNEPYHISKRNGTTSYPPQAYIYNVLHDRTKDLSDADKKYQKNLYMKYGFDADNYIIPIATITPLLSSILHVTLNCTKKSILNSTAYNTIHEVIWKACILLLVNSKIHTTHPNQVTSYISRCMKPLHIATAYCHNWLPVKVCHTVKQHALDTAYRAYIKAQDIYTTITQPRQNAQ